MERPTPGGKSASGPLALAFVSHDGPGSRRLQRMGAVTVGVSLPRDWVGSRGLAAGQSVFLTSLPDGSLLLRDSDLGRTPVAARLEIDPSEPPEHLFRRLIGAYLAGATEFVLHQPNGITSETRGIARSFARRTGHTESLAEEGATLQMRDVSVGSLPGVPQLLHRMFQLVHGLHVDAGSTWTRGSAVSGGRLPERDDEVDRYAWQIERSLRMGTLGEVRGARVEENLGDAYRYLLWARDLERIADHAVLIGEHGARLSEVAPPEAIRRMLTTYHAQALEHLAAAHRVAQAPDAARANAILDTGEALHVTQSSLADQVLMRESTERLPPVAIRSLGLILQSIDRTTGYAQNIAEIGLDRDLDRSTHPTASSPRIAGPRPHSSSNGTRGGTTKT